MGLSLKGLSKHTVSTHSLKSVVSPQLQSSHPRVLKGIILIQCAMLVNIDILLGYCLSILEGDTHKYCS